jgi:hypothetical protein
MKEIPKRTALTSEMIDSLPIIEPHIHIGATIRPIIALQAGIKSGLFRIVKTKSGFQLESDEFSESKSKKYSHYHQIFRNII